jgi:molybdopterin molybdotransferase
MLSVADAQALVLRHTQPLPPEIVPLDTAALGLVLAEAIASDLDMPPYDKALMDGYAVCVADLATGSRELTVIDEVTAGQVPRRSVGPGQAVRIMTGAPLPSGADAVVMIEETKLIGPDRVQMKGGPCRPGQNILPQAREMRRGEVVLEPGVVLRPPQFGLLATVGRTTARVFPRPRVAVLATGDELVEPTQVPGPGQIRNGNGPMLLAQVCRAGALPHILGIARDRLDSLRSRVTDGLRFPVLLLSGGVSAGKLDLVPGVLAELGVEAHFHKVAMKPGKPVFFGTRNGTVVFGLPGNPVSSLVCFELFVRPALRRLMGQADCEPRTISAALTENFAHKSDRPTYHPARLETNDDGCRVQPVPWFGSPDLRAVSQANAFVVFPPGDQQHRAGQRFPVMLVD